MTQSAAIETLTAETIQSGASVAFRSEFSQALIGIVWEIEAHSDGTLVHTEFGTKREFVMIRTRIGKSRRWGHRLAYLADLERSN